MTTALDMSKVRTSERYNVRTSARGAHNWDIRIKLFLLILVVVFNIGLAIPWLSGMLLIIGLVILIYASPSPARTALFFLVPCWRPRLLLSVIV